VTEPVMVHSTPLHIRYSDTDQMGVVHNSVYAIYCEQGRTDLCASFGMPYHKMEEDGLFMMVAEMSGRYHRAIRYGESISIRTVVARVKSRLIAFEYEIFEEKSGELCYSGQTTHLFSRDRMRTCTLPEPYLSKFKRIMEECSSAL